MTFIYRRNTSITSVSILLGVLALIGTLGGTILANRHATRLQELRIAQEKLKRDTVVIEEAYTLLNNIGIRFTDNVNNERSCSTDINDDLNRARTLVY